MKNFQFAMLSVFFFAIPLSAEDSVVWNSCLPLLNECSKSILGISEGKAYVNPDKTCQYQNRWFLQNDAHQWMPLQKVDWDGNGYYFDMREALCPNGHVGIYRVRNTWYCNELNCPWSIGENCWK